MSEILGYTKNGDPIRPIKPGMMATACVISCSICGHGIRGMGGPQHGAKCVPCFEKEKPMAPSTEYPVYPKDSPQAISFRETFSKARADGLAEFTWEGRRYNTKVKGE